MLRTKKAPTPYQVLIERYATLTLARGHTLHFMTLLTNCGLHVVGELYRRPLNRIERELVAVRAALKLEPEQ